MFGNELGREFSIGESVIHRKSNAPYVASPNSKTLPTHITTLVRQPHNERCDLVGMQPLCELITPWDRSKPCPNARLRVRSDHVDAYSSRCTLLRHRDRQANHACLCH